MDYCAKLCAPVETCIRQSKRVHCAQWNITEIVVVSSPRTFKKHSKDILGIIFGGFLFGFPLSQVGTFSSIIAPNSVFIFTRKFIMKFLKHSNSSLSLKEFLQLAVVVTVIVLSRESRHMLKVEYQQSRDKKPGILPLLTQFHLLFFYYMCDFQQETKLASQKDVQEN